jgi:hypothetical protein
MYNSHMVQYNVQQSRGTIQCTSHVVQYNVQQSHGTVQCATVTWYSTILEVLPQYESFNIIQYNKGITKL